MGCKAVETTHNINTFGPGTANECTMRWWFKKFCKETRALKMRSVVAGHCKLTMTNCENIEADLLRTTREDSQELSITPSMVAGHVKQIRKVKKLDKCVKSLSRVWLFATPWTVGHQGPLSLGFSRQEYWSRLPSPSPECLMSWPEKKNPVVLKYRLLLFCATTTNRSTNGSDCDMQWKADHAG